MEIHEAVKAVPPQMSDSGKLSDGYLMCTSRLNGLLWVDFVRYMQLASKRMDFKRASPHKYGPTS